MSPSLFLTIAAICILSIASSSSLPLPIGTPVVVTGHAHPFGPGDMIDDADIQVLELPQLGTIKTDKNGAFSFPATVGQNVTLVVSKLGYQTTTSSTMVVLSPPYTPQTELALQVPNLLIWAAFVNILKKETGENLSPGNCHMVVTVAAFNKTLYDCPQGEPNATIALVPAVSGAAMFYFGAFGAGPLHNLTDPFVTGLNETSWDGGVVIFNVPPSDTPYKIVAHKDGITNFSYSVMTCKPNTFVNGAPPWGPTVGGPLQKGLN